MPIRRRSLLLLSLLAALLVLEIATGLLGFRTRLPWFLWQLLGREWLDQSPLRSLALLHAQPPLLNALALAILRISQGLGVAEDQVTAAVLGLAGGLAAVAFRSLAESVTGSRTQAFAWSLVLLLQPGWWVFRHRFFYPFLLLAAFLGVAWLSDRFLRTGRPAWLAATGLGLLAVHWTRSLYPPIFGTLYLLLLGGLAARRRKRPILRPLVFVLLFHAALGQFWPLKNWIVFGDWIHSSWSGHNLARGIPIRQGANIGELRRLAKRPDCGPPCQISAGPPPRVLELGAPDQLVRPRTPEGHLNGNHYAFLLDRRRLTREALQWRLSHPGQYLRRLLKNYAWMTRASFVKPYGERLEGPRDPVWRAYCRAVRSVFFHPVPTPFLGRATPAVPLYGLLLPALLLLGTFRGLPGAVRGDPRGSLLLLLAWVLLWQTAIVCLTDAEEGNRMRVATMGPALLLLAGLFSPWVQQLQRRLRRGGLDAQSM